MHARFPLGASLLLAGCGGGTGNHEGVVDIGNAAASAQQSVDEYGNSVRASTRPVPQSPARKTIRDPAPAPTETVAGLPATADASYDCATAASFTVHFDNRADTATLERPGDAPADMVRQRVASGIWYAGDGYDLRGKGRQATLTQAGNAPVACTARE